MKCDPTTKIYIVCAASQFVVHHYIYIYIYIIYIYMRVCVCVCVCATFQIVCCPSLYDVTVTVLYVNEQQTAI